MTGEEKLFEVISWWEKRRWRYNAIVGLTGVAGIAILLRDLFMDYTGSFIFNIVLFALMANVCYTIGWAAAVWDAKRRKSTEAVGENRKAFFVLGTLLTVAVELYYIWMTAILNH